MTEYKLPSIDLLEKDIDNVVRIEDVIRGSNIEKNPNNIILNLGYNETTKKYITTDLVDHPHLLIAGATGTGKSVCLNTIISSILLNYNPWEVELILVDPKGNEFMFYENIPHLISPIINKCDELEIALDWCMKEMETRYSLLKEYRVRNAKQLRNKYNYQLSNIVMIIDEYADLIMERKSLQFNIIRLAQKSRAVGIHLIIATQKPIVQIVTGLIKGNFPARIAFKTVSQTDSRTILERSGAELLKGKGEMLFSCGSEIEKIQGCYISEDNTDRIVDFVRSQYVANYKFSLKKQINNSFSPKNQEVVPLIETEKFSSYFIDGLLVIDDKRTLEDKYLSILDYIRNDGVVDISLMKKIFNLTDQEVDKICRRLIKTKVVNKRMSNGKLLIWNPQ